jgi:hypothetical protein
VPIDPLRPWPQTKEAAEALCIKETLAGRLGAAHEFGISRMGLYKTLQKHRLASA